MYRKDTEGWSKHFDFMLLDLICLQLSYFLAYAVTGHGFDLYTKPLYINMALFITVADLAVFFTFDTLKNILKRGHYRNFLVTLKHGLILAGVSLLYLFLLQKGQDFSRLTLVFTFVIYIPLTYLVKELWKKVLGKRMAAGGSRSLLIVTTSDRAEEELNNMKEHNYARFTIAGIAVIDKDMVGESVDAIPIVANGQTAPEYVCQEWIDEVLVVLPHTYEYPEKLMRELELTGVTVHYGIARVSDRPGKRQFVEKVGNYTVLTTSLNYATPQQLFVKRTVDIAGGIVGCIMTGLIFIFVAPAIYISSPGPIFFSQERVGKNGKKFKMYKFRSMYMDAEARRDELMKDNKLGDGKMFKLDFDPRVIGNKILPDGTHKTGIGDFLRKTSLDEFPQFFNVLKGDMSIVGTRPPLVSETELYELHHHARLAIKPGLTGMWQVSGRSDITDFEEVVRLDREYIDNWDLGLDVKIMLKTVLMVLKRDGSV